MSPGKQAAPSPALLAWYNAVPNVLWSALSLVPLSIFCYQYMARPWLYGLGAGSLLAYGLPAAQLRRLQLSAAPATYRRLGVHLVNRFTQSGDLLNGLLRRRYPHYRRVRSRTSVAELVRTTYYQERFHLALFVFFLLTSGYAFWVGRWGWALLLGCINVVYNLYPMWLQQYLRLRVHTTLGKS